MRQLARPCSTACVLQHFAWPRALRPAIAPQTTLTTTVTAAAKDSCSACGTFSSAGSSCGRSISGLSATSSSSCSGSGGTSSGFGHMRRVAARATRGSGAATTSGESSGFWTLQNYVLYESEVKKSKFIVHAWPVSSSSEAISLIRAASDPSATHNCFAYRVGGEHRCSDDGEPGGTAGKPILSAIEGEELDRVAVLVTRHFGGTKLGVGGLVRAYGGAAKECLRLAPRVFAKEQVEVTVDVSYDELGIVYGCLDMYGCERLAEDYGSSGTVTLRARVDADRLLGLKAAVADGTAGRRRLELATAVAPMAEE